MWTISGVPEGAEALETGVVREGEATGHGHVIVGSEFQLYGRDGRVIADIQSDDCRIAHPEHAPVPLPKGVWEFGATYEYVYPVKISRPLFD